MTLLVSALLCYSCSYLLELCCGQLNNPKFSIVFLLLLSLFFVHIMSYEHKNLYLYYFFPF